MAKHRKISNVSPPNLGGEGKGERKPHAPADASLRALAPPRDDSAIPVPSVGTRELEDNGLANPPFNDSDWHRVDDDVRWQYGIPPKGNANFAWVQHFIHHLAPDGMAGFVLAGTTQPQPFSWL